MKIGPGLVSIAFLLASSFFSFATAANGDRHRSPLKYARTGKPLSLATDYDLDVNCSTIPGLKVRVVEPPRHGTINIIATSGFTHYLPANDHFKCNKKRSTMLATIYTSRPGFTGEDHAAVRVFSPLGGTARTYAFDISVK